MSRSSEEDDDSAVVVSANGEEDEADQEDDGINEEEVIQREGFEGAAVAAAPAAAYYSDSTTTPLPPRPGVQYESYEDMSHFALGGQGGPQSLSTAASGGGSGALSSSLRPPYLPHAPPSAPPTSASAATTASSSSLSAVLSLASPSYAASSSSFPHKLHRILRDPECTPDLITWLPHGRAWRVRDQEGFEGRCLPRYFRHGRFASFLRQVNGWVFKRVLSGPDENAYYHEYFLRGLPEVSQRMQRNSATTTNSPRQQAQGGSCRRSSSANPSSSSSSSSSALKAQQPDIHRSILVPPDFYHITELHPLPDADGNWSEDQGPLSQQNNAGEVPSSSAAVATLSAAEVAASSINFRNQAITSSTGPRQLPPQQLQQQQGAGVFPAATNIGLPVLPQPTPPQHQQLLLQPQQLHVALTPVLQATGLLTAAPGATATPALAHQISHLQQQLQLQGVAAPVAPQAQFILPGIASTTAPAMAASGVSALARFNLPMAASAGDPHLVGALLAATGASTQQPTAASVPVGLAFVPQPQPQQNPTTTVPLLQLQVLNVNAANPPPPQQQQEHARGAPNVGIPPQEAAAFANLVQILPAATAALAEPQPRQAPEPQNAAQGLLLSILARGSNGNSNATLQHLQELRRHGTDGDDSHGSEADATNGEQKDDEEPDLPG